jgi:hypothetical protein
MSMEKVGVSNKVELQKRELSQVKMKLASLNIKSQSLEKTAEQTQETERLEKRAIELQVEIAEQ